MAKGHTEVVPQSELQMEPGKVWYVPHHVVYHPRKKKLHVVFCVLLCFRQGPVAFMADIKGKVKVGEELFAFFSKRGSL